MSDTMLFGVLKMPFEMAMRDAVLDALGTIA
jgi:hypothetical protein